MATKMEKKYCDLCDEDNSDIPPPDPIYCNWCGEEDVPPYSNYFEICAKCLKWDKKCDCCGKKEGVPYGKDFCVKCIRNDLVK